MAQHDVAAAVVLDPVRHLLGNPDRSVELGRTRRTLRHVVPLTVGADLVYPVIALSPSSRYPFGARIARSCGNPGGRSPHVAVGLWTTGRRAPGTARRRRGEALGCTAWKVSTGTAANASSGTSWGGRSPVPSRTVGDAVLHLHRAERADTLAAALADLITEPPADPFTAEVVAVPARGMERWLAHRLAHRLGTASGRGDGVCAHVAFPAPGEVVATARRGRHGDVRRRRPLAPRPGGVAAPGGRRHLHGPAVVRSPGRSSGAGAQQVRGGRARHRAVRRLRHPPARAARRLARGRRRGRARGPALAAGAVAGPARADRRAGPRGAAGHGGRRAGARPRVLRPAGAAVAVRPHPPARGPPRRTRGPRPPSRRAPVAAAPLARPVGPRRADWPWACPRAAPIPPPSSRAIRCSPRSAGTSGSCSCGWRASPASTRTTPAPTARR